MTKNRGTASGWMRSLCFYRIQNPLSVFETAVPPHLSRAAGTAAASAAHSNAKGQLPPF